MGSIRVLITGAGSGVGQGILKALRLSTLDLTLVCADISPMNCALFRADEAVLIPRVEEVGALARMIEVIRQKKIQVVMIGSEFDLSFFSEHREQIERETSARVIVSPLETVRIAEDKWLTAEFLRENGLPYSEAFLPKDLADAVRLGGSWGYPFVLKTRKGTSSRHVHVISDRTALETLYPLTPHPMLQKLITLPSTELGAEYTCSIFKLASGGVLGPFTSRRTLRGGSSWNIEVAPFPELFPMLLEIGRRLPVTGSLNVQLMIGKNGPTPFEFNARFSGTTAVRAHFGFNEPDMALRDYFLGEKVPQPVPRSGLAMRYIEEVFIDGASALEAARGFPKGMVHPWF